MSSFHHGGELGVLSPATEPSIVSLVTVAAVPMMVTDYFLRPSAVHGLA